MGPFKIVLIRRRKRQINHLSVKNRINREFYFYTDRLMGEARRKKFGQKKIFFRNFPLKFLKKCFFGLPNSLP